MRLAGKDHLPPLQRRVQPQHLLEEFIEVCLDLPIALPLLPLLNVAEARVHGLIDVHQERLLVPRVGVLLERPRATHSEGPVLQKEPVHAGAARPSIEPDDERRGLQRGAVSALGREEPVEQPPLMRLVHGQAPRPLARRVAAGYTGQIRHQVVVRRGRVVRTGVDGQLSVGPPPKKRRSLCIHHLQIFRSSLS
eukprot:scaffold576_cov260-Pinguiococcus_pyrenoidosus.AAC.105